MATLTVRNVPGKLHALLKERAREHRRSLNSEVLEVLAEAVDVKEADRQAAMERVRRRRRNGPTIRDSPEEMKRKAREGLA